MIPPRALGVLWAAASLAAAPPALAKEPPLPTLPIVVAVASEAGKPVRDDAWIDAQVAEAERLFGGVGLHLKKTAQRPLDERFARLETRKDRDALAGQVQKGVINVMIVASLRDVDDTRLYRMGVHWRPVATPRVHYVIVSADALGSTMAHEIGHFFGLPHTAEANNVMSYSRSGVPPHLGEGQAKTARSFARIYLGSKELAGVP